MQVSRGKTTRGQALLEIGVESTGHSTPSANLATEMPENQGCIEVILLLEPESYGQIDR